MNSSCQIVGWEVTETHAYRAWLYSEGQVHDLAPAGYPHDINDAGLVVGDGFLYDSAAPNPEVVPLGSMHPKLDPAAATAVDNRGEIVGSLQWGSFHLRDGVLTDLNQAIAPASGWMLDMPTDINDAGEIVGYGLRLDGDSYREVGFLLTPEHKWVRDRRLEALIEILFGITGDGGGLGIAPGGQPVPVDPLGWRALLPQQRNDRVRRLLGELAELVSDEALRSELERLGLPGQDEAERREGEPD
ncbi:MAG: hypothetical protein ACJ76S_02025 [Solirubrobacteraceae bacterium]